MLVGWMYLLLWMFIIIEHGFRKLVVVGRFLLIVSPMRVRVVDSHRELSRVERDRSRGISVYLQDGGIISVPVRRREIDVAVAAIERLRQLGRERTADEHQDV